jgi:sugar phosphate isomerase/epimerase
MTNAISRRSFLAASAASAVGLLATRSVAAEPIGFNIGVQSYTFRDFALEPALKRMQELGFKNAEFFSSHIPPNSPPEKIKSILGLCMEYGVTPVGFGVSGFGKNHDANKKLFELGAALGLKYLSADPDPSPECFNSLDKLCDEYKIAIAIHPHGPVGGKNLHRWYSAEIIMKAVKDHNKLIGSCLDVGHLIRVAQVSDKLDPIEQVKIMGDRNFALHLKDFDNKRKAEVVLGDPNGNLDLLALFKTLRDINFKGTANIEYENNASNSSPDVKKGLAFVNETLAKLT